MDPDLPLQSSPDPQGGPTHSKIGKYFTFSTAQTSLPEPSSQGESLDSGVGGARPLLPGVVALLTLAWLRQREVPGLAG